ncbi:hypothetical protein [uncultured Amaricoccus sp.]|uniref:hypothetical protein n=1 Tax=uncultured Amaricoccus sp. TaxID=339341 RepID=UPI002626CC10|nr:hypothetical protein [uncultured Amaricoccus sp.]
MPPPARIVRPSARPWAWLNGVLAALIAVAAVIAPAQHERMMLGRAVAALAAAAEVAAPPHGHGDQARRGAEGAGGHDHLAAPACFACLLMGAPGLPAVAFAGVAKYPARVKCALLGWMAFKDALAQASGEKHALAARTRSKETAE